MTPYASNMTASDLTDAQWQRLRPLLPSQKPRTGRPARSAHGPQRPPLLPLGGSWRSCRALRLVEDRLVPLLSLARRPGSGIAFWPRCSGRQTRTGGSTGACISWTARSFERTSTRAGQSGDPAAEALGRSRGGYSTKVHLRCERGGKPMVLVLTSGERHEQPVLPTLKVRGAVFRQGRGRPRDSPRSRWPRSRATAARQSVGTSRRAGSAWSSRPRPAKTRSRCSTETAYRERNVVERLINRLKQSRRIATRSEKRAANYDAMLTIASCSSGCDPVPTHSRNSGPAPGRCRPPRRHPRTLFGVPRSRHGGYWARAAC